MEGREEGKGHQPEVGRQARSAACSGGCGAGGKVGEKRDAHGRLRRRWGVRRETRRARKAAARWGCRREARRAQEAAAQVER